MGAIDTRWRRENDFLTSKDNTVKRVAVLENKVELLLKFINKIHYERMIHDTVDLCIDEFKEDIEKPGGGR